MKYRRLEIGEVLQEGDQRTVYESSLAGVRKEWEAIPPWMYGTPVKDGSFRRLSSSEVEDKIIDAITEWGKHFGVDTSGVGRDNPSPIWQQITGLLNLMHFSEDAREDWEVAARQLLRQFLQCTSGWDGGVPLGQVRKAAAALLDEEGGGQ